MFEKPDRWHGFIKEYLTWLDFHLDKVYPRNFDVRTPTLQARWYWSVYQKQSTCHSTVHRWVVSRIRSHNAHTRSLLQCYCNNRPIWCSSVDTLHTNRPKQSTSAGLTVA